MNEICIYFLFLHFSLSNLALQYFPSKPADGNQCWCGLTSNFDTYLSECGPQKVYSTNEDCFNGCSSDLDGCFYLSIDITFAGGLSGKPNTYICSDKSPLAWT